MKVLKRIGHFVKYHFDVFTMKTAMQIFAVIMLISGGALYTSYTFSLRNIEAHALESSQRSLREIVNMVDANISYADGIASSLSISREAIYLSSIQHISAQDKILHVTSMVNLLLLEKHSNSLFHSIYLYYPKNELVIYDALYQAKDVVDAQYVSVDNGQLVSLTKNTRFSRYTDYGFQDLLKITKQLGTESQDAYVVVNISAEELSRFVEDMKLSAGEEIYICDSQGGAVLAGREPPQGLEAGVSSWAGEKHIIAQQVSPLTGWRFTMVIPFDEFYSNYRSIQVYIPLISLGMFLLSVIFGFVITLRISRPVNRLYYSVTKDKEPGRDHLQYLLQSYEELWPVHQQLKEEMGLMQFLLHAPPDEAEKLQSLRTYLPYDSFWVLTVDLLAPQTQASGSEYLNSVLCYPLIQDAFLEFEGKAAIKIAQMEPHRLAVVLNFDSKAIDQEAFIPVFSNLVISIHEELNTSVNLGISNVKTALEQVYVGFQESLKAIEYKFLTGNNELIYFGDINLPHFSTITYPSELEQELLEGLRLGDAARAREALKSLRAYNDEIESTHPAYSYMMLSCMINTVRQVVFRIMPESQAEAVCQAAIGDGSGDRIESMEIMCADTISFMGEVKKNKNEIMAQNILAYIDENYAQPITVESISQTFRISTSSCYRILREQKQISPTSYITQVRVEQAAHLLETTQEPVNKIFAQCGFESLQIFYRQFKNLKGTSPGAYRRSRQEGDG